MTDKALIEAAKEALRLLRNFSDEGIRLYCDDCGGDPDQCPSTCCIPMGMVACEDLEASIAQAEQSASATSVQPVAWMRPVRSIINLTDPPVYGPVRYVACDKDDKAAFPVYASAPTSAEDARDAARYRFIRHGDNEHGHDHQQEI